MLMSTLRDATTDAAVIDGLSMLVQARASAGVYGADRRGTLRERRTRKRIDRAFGDCCKWYRANPNHARRPVPPELVKSKIRSALAGGILGWLAWLGFQWLLEIIVREFVEWLLSSESAAWRDGQ